MIKLPKMSERDLFSEFGNPADSDFKEKIEEQLVEINLPFALNKGKTHTIKCHAVISIALLDVLTEIGSIYTEKQMQDLGIDNYHGCHNIRPVRGFSGYWSIHSWGCAVDFNSHLGAMGIPSTMPYFFVKAFEERGFYWGGRWSRPDGMHFSLVKG